MKSSRNPVGCWQSRISRPSMSTANPSSWTSVPARMLEIFAERSFNNTGFNHHMRLALIAWVIRNKILGNLKRALDILVSLVIIPLASPIMLVTAVAIKLTSPGPVLFRQQRVGIYGKPFTCFKFRSMYIDAEERKAELMHLNEADEVVFKMTHDPRVTKVGRIIRKYSIDEVAAIFQRLTWRDEPGRATPTGSV